MIAPAPTGRLTDFDLCEIERLLAMVLRAPAWREQETERLENLLELLELVPRLIEDLRETRQ